MPKILSIPNILGETEQDASPGYVLFTLDATRCASIAVVEDDQQLFFIFHDLTAGKRTYRARAISVYRSSQERRGGE